MTGAGTSELWLAACHDWEGKKGREKLLQGVWYSFYGKSSKPMGPRDVRAVLQLHPALDLHHHGPVREGV